MSIANRIRDLRCSAGLTQKELSDKTGIALQSIINYENGRREPNSKAMAALEQYFNVSGSYLRGEADTPTYSWEDAEMMTAVSDSLDILSTKLVETIRASGDCEQKMAFDILVELRHVLSMKEAVYRPAAMMLLQETFALSTRFLDVCLNSVSSGVGDTRIEKMKQRCVEDFFAALDAFQAESCLDEK